MKPDLSKIVVGSRVTFVADQMDVKNFKAAAICILSACQIIAIEPPEFDWSSVRPGMRFDWLRATPEYVWYVGPYRYNPSKVIVEDGNGETHRVAKSDLTPAPEIASPFVWVAGLIVTCGLIVAAPVFEAWTEKLKGEALDKYYEKLEGEMK